MHRFESFLKTGILFAALTALLIGIGYIIGGRGGAVFFFMISLVMNFGSYWFSDKLALMMAHAKPISESEASEVYQDVRDLSSRMNLPMPRIYMSPEMQPNAFATGRNPKHSALCLTAGIMQVLNRDELRAVISHELGHIKNYDVLITTIAAVIAGAISSLAHMLMFFGGRGDDENRNPLAELLVLFLAPITATLIQLAISRSREYAADEIGSEYTHEPEDLANALLKIDSVSRQVPMNVNPALSSLYISNPFKDTGFLNLFSTHPPVEERVKRLMSMRLK